MSYMNWIFFVILMFSDYSYNDPICSHLSLVLSFE